MDVDPSWSFDDYQAYERARLDESLAEQARAQADGLEVDPKSEPHGGYRIACVWPAQVTSAASALSARLAGLLPGTPAYPYQAIHSSIGNISAPDGRLVDPTATARTATCSTGSWMRWRRRWPLTHYKPPMGGGWRSGPRCSPHAWRWCLAGPNLATGRCTELSMPQASLVRSTW
jgi:hypothetical protein